MGTTLDHGIYLPDEGERNCYEGLAGNWVALDNHLGSTNIHVTINDKQAWDGHVADTTIHVTSADKQAWNGHVADSVKHVTAEDKAKWDAVTSKADASALTAHTGDTTIHVTAEDKAKWDAVTGKANDADVVHKTGIETIKDRKTFESTPYIYNSDSSGITPYLFFKSAKAIKGDTSGSNSDSIRIALVDKNDKVLNYIQLRKVSNGSSDITLYCSTIDGNSQEISSSLTFFKTVNGQGTLRANADNDVNLGNSTYKWRDVSTYLFNGINPGALSLPNYVSRADISGYIINITGANNTYTPPADGFVFVRSDNATYLSIMDTPSGVCQVSQAGTAGTIGLYFPVLKGRGVYIKIVCTSLNIAYFIPCQGNI